MYTQEDIQANSRAQARMIRFALVPAVLLLAGVVVSVVFRVEWLSDLLTILMLSELFFLYEMKIKPIVSYGRMLSGCVDGKKHEYTGELKNIGTELCTVEGVSYHPVTLCVGKLRNEDDDRLLYFDAEKQPPTELIGSNVTFTVHDKTIVDWKAQALA
ncbi:MAG: hypothetical protein PHI27_01305 [Eubacteriales bacterium]|nr:hypothetical protein [Eubacteriales bacterium]MDD3880872.1 hypothetical protein [Eubacteriales bacterium]MDD4511761.1 hypothetical protein [Eubacteriales bacterium]